MKRILIASLLLLSGSFALMPRPAHAAPLTVYFGSRTLFGSSGSGVITLSNTTSGSSVSGGGSFTVSTFDDGGRGTISVAYTATTVVSVFNYDGGLGGVCGVVNSWPGCGPVVAFDSPEIGFEFTSGGTSHFLWVYCGLSRNAYKIGITTSSPAPSALAGLLSDQYFTTFFTGNC